MLSASLYAFRVKWDVMRRLPRAVSDGIAVLVAWSEDKGDPLARHCAALR